MLPSVSPVSKQTWNMIHSNTITFHSGQAGILLIKEWIMVRTVYYPKHPGIPKKALIWIYLPYLKWKATSPNTILHHPHCLLFINSLIVQYPLVNKFWLLAYCFYSLLSSLPEWQLPTGWLHFCPLYIVTKHCKLKSQMTLIPNVRFHYSVFK